MLGLYLHIPFCRRKCPYCDFFSVAAGDPHFRVYPKLLRQHLDWAAAHGWRGPIDTVYFGGGTPSLLSPRVIGSLLDTVARRFGLTADAEITLEANPGTVTAARLCGYRAAGVNRLSLGLQSLDPAQLVNLGRLHGRNEGLQAVNWARRAGFDRLSLDLIFALPGQTLSALDAELDRYLALAPEHLSCYGLTAEPDTLFHQRVQTGELQLPDGEFYADAFLLLHERLTAAGYEHYEIANYARPGQACRHNLGYWQRRPYLGVGAGAHSFRDAGGGERWAVPPDLDAYGTALRVGHEPAVLLENFEHTGAMSEMLYLGLRTRSGVEDAAFRAGFGRGVAEAFPQAVERLRPWLVFEEGNWRMTVAGWLIYDRLIQEFL
ncbi:MAG: radical SAM family heme chaperone HemW [Desulfuromonadales bacterium]|nr:radical SAM family heme chaperone HemW [Desulfuromonadales bacterium]